jgi:hypothetical protein
MIGLLQDAERDGQKVAFEYGDEECKCCIDCCQNIITGEFNSDGDLVMETAVLAVVLVMPTKFSRLFCNDDKLKLKATLKSPFNVGSTFFWHLWHDRDWLHDAHGEASGGDLHCGANWWIWESTTPDATADLTWTECYVDYPLQYGDIVFGTEVGEPTEEFIEILCEKVTIPAGTDCCPYETECEPCKYELIDQGYPVGPEVTREGITFWDDDPSGWSMRGYIEGVDSVKKTIERNDPIEIDSDIRPPKNFYLQYSTSITDICLTHINWIDGFGSQFHPRQTLPDATGATACHPTAYAEQVTCPDITRIPAPSAALKFDWGITSPPCLSPCGEEEEVTTPTVTAVVTSETPDVTLSISFQFNECPNPEEIDCCGDCTISTIFSFQIEFANGAGESSTAPNPPVDVGTLYVGEPGRAEQIGVIIEDCTNANGARLVTWFLAVCPETFDGAPNDDEVRGIVEAALAALYGEVVASADLNQTSYITGTTNLISICNQIYNDPPLGGECNSIELCDLRSLDDSTLACCQGV